VPLTSWFRFRRAVEPTATVLLLLEQEPYARTCASLVLRMQAAIVCASECSNSVAPHMDGSGESITVPRKPVVSHAALLRGMNLRVQVERSPSQRKPPQSAAASFALRTAI
jgi:hypothetical protein